MVRTHVAIMLIWSIVATIGTVDAKANDWENEEDVKSRWKVIHVDSEQPGNNTLSAAATLSAEEITIENSNLSVTADGSSFSISSKQAGRFVKKAEFPVRVIRTETSCTSSPNWGKGKKIVFTHEDGSTSTLEIFDDSPFAALHTTVCNKNSKPLEIKSLELLNMQVLPGDRELMSYGTGGLRPPNSAGGSYTFHVYADPETRNGVVTAWLTHERGVGVFFPSEDNGNASLKAQLDFGHFQVKPGSSRPTDTLLIGYFDDARFGLEMYASTVAKHYNIKLEPRPNVYCTWYHAGASNEGKIQANTEFAAEHLAPYGLNVMQIDDHWQSLLPKGFKHDRSKIKTTGPIKVFADVNHNYRNGMAHTAKMITSHNMVAGIWFMPFAGNFRNPYFDHDVFAKNPDGTPFHDARWSGTCLDASNPKAQKFLYDRVKRIYDWGYRYFKIDGMHTGMPSYNIYVNTDYQNHGFGKAILHDPYMTHVEAYRKALTIVKDAAPEVFVLGCNVSQNMRCMGPAFGLIEAMRIGPDNGSAGNGNWGGVTTGARHGSNLYFLNGRIWYNDPDPVYVRPGNSINAARWMCSWLAVSGGMHTSSEQYQHLPPERLDILKRCLPGHDLPARPVDLFENNKARIWLVENNRMALIGLFNWSDKKEEQIKYDMGKLGLDKSKTYTAFDFWENKSAGTIKDTLVQTLPAGTCRILALKEACDHPQLISTSRHITQGLIDVIEEKWERNTLSGKSKVVANDPYELRIALPAEGGWKAMKASADGAEIKLVNTEDKILRAVITTAKSGTVSWKVMFK